MEYTSYVARQGDTWDMIAFKVYGDEFLASTLIVANRYLQGTVIFEGGEVVRVPVLSENDLTPNLPPWRA